MLTVIIAEQELIDVFDRYESFLRPLHGKEILLCPWNRDGETLTDMVPQLHEAILYHNRWRAIVVNNDRDRCAQINPFDFTGVEDGFRVGPRYDRDAAKQRREKRFAGFDAAMANPLTKLTAALCGVPQINAVLPQEVYQALVSGEMSPEQYQLTALFSSINRSETAANLSLYGERRMKTYVKGNEADYQRLLTAIEEGDVDAVLSLIPMEEARPDDPQHPDYPLADFIRFVGKNDPRFCDSEYLESLLENTKKAQLFQALAASFSWKDKMPVEVLCLSPRTFDTETYDQNVNWNDNDEFYYSKFASRNLYPEGLKYFVFDMLPRDDKQFLSDQIRLLCFLLVLAGNELPAESVRLNRVYRADVRFDVSSIARICKTYLSKLDATKSVVHEQMLELSREESQVLDNETARALFEAHVSVPVTISEFKTDDLYATYEGLGLATNCPQDEYTFWQKQYHNIRKLFVRYLREPRRAVKSAVKNSFRPQSKIEDDRALLLNENQQEDVLYFLQEEEQQMVETRTSQIYNTAAYTERMEEADEALKRGIAQRMTRRKTVLIGSVALLAYFLGFLPLLFSNLNTVGSFLMSLCLIGVSLALFTCVGLVILFVFRRQLRNRFIHFNKVMGGILNEIDDGLKAFERYLKHACQVMREFSVLNFTESSVGRRMRVFKNHLYDIAKKEEEIYNTFSSYIDPNGDYTSMTAEPYDYDFTKVAHYPYDMPHPDVKERVAFLGEGSFVELPVEYIKSVTVTREELYD